MVTVSSYLVLGIWNRCCRWKWQRVLGGIVSRNPPALRELATQN